MHYVFILLSIAQVILSLGLIFIVAIQQTKSEGLSGTIGGQVTSSFKGKPGFDERLNDITKNLGIAFFVVSVLVALTLGR